MQMLIASCCALQTAFYPVGEAVILCVHAALCRTVRTNPSVIVVRRQLGCGTVGTEQWCVQGLAHEQQQHLK